MAFNNLALGSIVTAPSPATSGTSMVVDSDAVASMPVVSTDGEFFITAFPSNQIPHLGNAEILKVTANASTTWTIERAQRGSSAKSIEAGWIILQGIYKENFINDPTMATASSDTIPMSESVKAYGRAPGASIVIPNDTAAFQTKTAVGDVINLAKATASNVVEIGSSAASWIKLLSGSGTYLRFPLARRGGSSTNWATGGGTSYNNGDAFIQCGTHDKVTAGTVGEIVTVNFPVEYSQVPIVVCVASPTDVSVTHAEKLTVVVDRANITTSNFKARSYFGGSTYAGIWGFMWIAIGTKT